MTEQFSDFQPKDAQEMLLDKLSRLIHSSLQQSLIENHTEDSQELAEHHMRQKAERDILKRIAINIGVPPIIVMALDFEPYKDNPQFLAAMLASLKTITEITKDEEKYLRNRFNF